MSSPALDLSGFAVTGIGPSDVINSVTAAVNGWTSNILTGPLRYELRDGETGALLGTATGTASTSTAHNDVVTFPAPAWSQLFWLHLLIYADPGTAPSGTTVSADYATLSVTYVSSGIPFAAPVTVPGRAAAAAPDATGPSGRVFIDVAAEPGPTTPRAQFAVATAIQGNGKAAGMIQGDGTAAGLAITRAQVIAGPVRDDGTAAGTVTSERKGAPA